MARVISGVQNSLISMRNTGSEYVLVVDDVITERRWMRDDAEAREWVRGLGLAAPVWDLMRVSSTHLVPVANEGPAALLTHRLGDGSRSRARMLDRESRVSPPYITFARRSRVS